MNTSSTADRVEHHAVDINGLRTFYRAAGARARLVRAERQRLKYVRVELLDSVQFALEEDAVRVAELIKQTF